MGNPLAFFFFLAGAGFLFCTGADGLGAGARLTGAVGVDLGAAVCRGGSVTGGCTAGAASPEDASAGGKVVVGSFSAGGLGIKGR